MNESLMKILLTMCICGLCWLAVANDTVGHGEITKQATADSGWRRTANGWEHVSTWVERPAVNRSMALHPLQLAIFQCGCSLAALLCANDAKDSQRRRTIEFSHQQ